MKRVLQFLIIGLVTGLVNCSRDAVPCTKTVSQALIDAVPKTQLAADRTRIMTYLAANSITATEDPSGLWYVITTAGTGGSPCLESSIVVNYVGKTLLSNNTTLATNPFDAQTGVTFQLNGLILGWQIGFLKLQPGSSAKFFIPSGLGYGTKTGITNIPVNSVLVFDVDLTSFVQP